MDEIQRGQVVARPGTISATMLVDARLHYLREAPKALLHNTQVDFFSGAAEVPARMRLLDKSEISPGQTGWVQIQLAGPVAVAKGDRYIVRFASPSITVGGGIIVDPYAKTRHRDFEQTLWKD